LVILPFLIYGIRVSNVLVVLVGSVIEIQLIIALVLQKRRMFVVRNGDVLEFVITGSISGSSLSSRGIKWYRPIVIDPHSKEHVEVKNKVNVSPFLKGAKIIGFKLHKRYWFPELDHILVRGDSVEIL
jgi:hypothetical protein